MIHFLAAGGGRRAAGGGRRAAGGGRRAAMSQYDSLAVI
jgi:hypothetical protein